MRSGRGDAFTIMEILIATTILVVGLLGVLALFPAAIHTGKVAVQETTAAAIAKSVADAIRTGIRYRKHSFSGGRSQDLFTFFIFEHDGVQDVPPSEPQDADPTADYFIALPFITGRRFDNENGAYWSGPVFVYPEDDEGRAGRPSSRGGRWVWDDPGRADDDADDDEDGEPNPPDDPFYLEIRKVYTLGNHLPEEIRADDPIAQYSYAFAIRVADRDGNRNVNPQQHWPGNDLFEVRVMVFRGFRAGTTSADPIYETSFLVAR